MHLTWVTADPTAIQTQNRHALAGQARYFRTYAVTTPTSLLLNSLPVSTYSNQACHPHSTQVPAPGQLFFCRLIRPQKGSGSCNGRNLQLPTSAVTWESKSLGNLLRLLPKRGEGYGLGCHGDTLKPNGKEKMATVELAGGGALLALTHAEESTCTRIQVLQH